MCVSEVHKWNKSIKMFRSLTVKYTQPLNAGKVNFGKSLQNSVFGLCVSAPAGETPIIPSSILKLYLIFSVILPAWEVGAVMTSSPHPVSKLKQTSLEETGLGLSNEPGDQRRWEWADRCCVWCLMWSLFTSDGSSLYLWAETDTELCRDLIVWWSFWGASTWPTEKCSKLGSLLTLSNIKMRLQLLNFSFLDHSVYNNRNC